MKKMLLALVANLILSLSVQAGYVVIEKKNSAMRCVDSELVISTKALNEVLPKKNDPREIRFYASVAHFGCEAILEKILEKDYLVLEIKKLFKKTSYTSAGELKWCNYEQNGDEFCYEKLISVESYILDFEIVGFQGVYQEEIEGSRKVYEDISINGSCPVYRPDCDL